MDYINLYNMKEASCRIAVYKSAVSYIVKLGGFSALLELAKCHDCFMPRLGEVPWHAERPQRLFVKVLTMH